jgi:methionyl-tRNA synthetase
MMNYIGSWGPANVPAFFGPMIVLVVIWSLAWKGVALWRAAGRKDLYWFIALLVINTLGILEILYILIWNKRPHHHSSV